MLLLQVLQQELEGWRKEKPGLTPRPSRELAPIRAFIDSDKVAWLGPMLKVAQ